MKLLKILSVIIIISSLSACTSLTQMREIEDAVLVCAVGFDRNGDLIKMSAEISFKSEKTVVLTSTGQTAEECISKIDKNISQSLILSHCGSVVLGQNLTHKTATQILDYLFLSEKFPLNCYIVSADNAFNILNCEIPSEEPVGYSLANLLTDKYQNIDSRIFSLYKSDEILLPCFTTNEKYLKREDTLWKIN